MGSEHGYKLTARNDSLGEIQRGSRPAGVISGDRAGTLQESGVAAAIWLAQLGAPRTACNRALVIGAEVARGG